MARIIRGNWSAITDGTSYSGVAVYAVRLLQHGRVVRICRFLGIDSEGILTIGMTTNLDRRRRGFISGSKRGHGHSAGNLLYPLLRNRPSRRKLRSPAFQLAFKAMPNREAARKREITLTHQYWKRFGEVPPLTSALTPAMLIANTRKRRAPSRVTPSDR